MAAGLHFLLVPLVAQGHIIPAVDLARLLAARGARVTVVTTPVNAARNRAAVEGARRAGLDVEFAEIAFPGPEFGLPEGLENMDMLVEYLLPGRLEDGRAAGGVPPVAAPPPGLPRRRLVQPVNGGGVRPPRHPATGAALPLHLLPPRHAQPDQARRVRPRRRRARELRGAGLPRARRREQGHVPGLLPVARRGGLPARRRRRRGHRRRPDPQHVPRHRGRLRRRLRGGSPPEDVGRGPTPGRGLEASGRPFVWAIKEANSDAGVRAWLLADGFEERVGDRGLLVRGWAPQVTILSHQAVGGFLTHCGWNATLEAIAHGVPALTWPNFSDQFSSEQLLVDVLGVGVRSGVTVPAMFLPEEAEGVQVTSAGVEKAVAELMDEGAEGAARRARAKEIAAKAKAAVEEGGSSYADRTDMIAHVAELSRTKSNERDTSARGLASAPELGSENSEKMEAGAALSLQS